MLQIDTQIETSETQNRTPVRKGLALWVLELLLLCLRPL
jgi:hypothetical protein